MDTDWGAPRKKGRATLLGGVADCMCERIVNLKTAKALGLDVPSTCLRVPTR